MLISFPFHLCSYEWKFMNLLYDSLFFLCIRAHMSEKLCISCMTLFFCLCIRALMSEKLWTCCTTLFFPLHLPSHEWKNMHLLCMTLFFLPLHLCSYEWKNIHLFCMTLLLPLHSCSYEWKIMHLWYDFVFWQRTSVYLILVTRAINIIIVLWEGPASI